MIKKFLAGSMAACMILLTACSSGGSSSAVASGTATSEAGSSATTTAIEIPAGESVSQEKDVVAATEADLMSMDPVDTSDTLSGGVQRLVMDGLFGFDDDMNVIPMLATEYTSNEDATEYTIILRQGISFTDGTPWNAEAAKANFDKWGDKTLGLKRTSMLSNILDTVEVVDEYTIKVNLTEPFGAFINNLAHPAMVINSPAQIAEGVEACKNKAIGTGQYKFVEWVPGDHVTLELNKEWWGYSSELTDGEPLADEDAGFKTITFKPVPEGTSRTSMVRSGDAQIMWLVPTESVDSLKQDSSVSVGTRESLVARYLFMNTQKEPFNDVRVRQAINYAINREAYIQVVDNGFASVPTTVMGPATQFAIENAAPEYNVEKAKELLTEAGYPDGFTTTIMASNTSANTKRAQFIQQQLAAVGITVEVVQEENALILDKVQNATGPGEDVVVDMFLSGWSSSTGDADWALRPIFDSVSIPPTSFNVSYYSNPEVDQLLLDGLQTADTTKRAEAYKKAQEILWEECPLITLSIDNISWATSSKIINVSLFPDGAINLRAARMAK